MRRTRGEPRPANGSDFRALRPPSACCRQKIEEAQMSPNPVLIAQISDLHIKSPGQLAYGRVDTGRALERCITALNEFRPRPDPVAIPGDLRDTPTADEYEHLKRLLSQLDLRFGSIPGNHDSRKLM